MFDFLAGLLAELYKLWPSFGGAIILFTALIMLALSPLSIKSTRSMIAMQRVGPEVKKLQQKHKGDREALNKEMMAFYQEHNINPFSSCLPLLLQIPVFFVLYQVLIGLTRRSDPSDPTSFFNPKYLEGEDTPLAVALRSTNEMMSFGMDLSQSAWTELRTEGLVTALPFVVLVALVVITAVVQQRQVQGRNPAAAVNPQQQMIAKVIPFIFVPISISLPAGVVIYFVVSNLVRIGQQALVTRLDFKDVPLSDGGKGDKKSSPKLSPGGNGGKRAADADRPARADKSAKAAKQAVANGRAPNKTASTKATKGTAAGKAPAKNRSGRGGADKATSPTNGAGPNRKGNDGKTPAPGAPRPRKRKRKRR
ncbi:MAG TPA: YidC/Oxa1 family membrane protein insertase [Acidimicrobiales bacterium]|nr:YidC/Oxa1 family membrane protein insertase [Acidimicrobiales bacterium]